MEPAPLENCALAGGSAGNFITPACLMHVSEFRVPGEGEVLGKVLEMLGDGRFRVICADGEIRVARLPGRLRKKLWLKAGDYVIVALWDFEKDKGDIVHKYDKRDVEELKRRGFAEAIENLERYA